MKLNEINTFLFFPSVTWNHNWERQHELIYKMVEKINQEVFISQPLGMINYNVVELVKKFRNRKRAIEDKAIINKTTPKMKFVSPQIIPFHFIDTFDKLNYYLILQQFPQFKTKQKLIWTTYVNGVIYEIFKESRFKILDIAVRRQTNPYLSNKAKLLEKKAVVIADLVFVDNQNTYLDYKDLNKNIFYLPQAVNVDKFTSTEIASEYKYLFTSKKTIIGYCGSFHQYIDFNFLHQIIPELENAIFLFVGNIIDQRAEELKKYPNVIFTGRKKPEELIFFYNIFDIGIIPYTIEPFTTGVFPTKFFEYSACGIPILSSPLPDLLDYNFQFIHIYYNKASFMDGVNKLCKLKNILKDDIKEFARKNTWEHRFSFIEEKLEGI